MFCGGAGGSGEPQEDLVWVRLKQRHCVFTEVVVEAAGLSNSSRAVGFVEQRRGSLLLSLFVWRAFYYLPLHFIYKFVDSVVFALISHLQLRLWPVLRGLTPNHTRTHNADHDLHFCTEKRALQQQQQQALCVAQLSNRLFARLG